MASTTALPESRAFAHSVVGPFVAAFAGREYVTLTSAGVKPEGGSIAFFHDSPDEAWSAYCSELVEFLAEKPKGVVAWRCRPRCEEAEGRFKIYSRLAVVENRNG